MKSSAWVVALALGAGAANAGNDPFDKARVAPPALVQQEAPVGAIAAPASKPAVNVLCGIRQSVDSAALCVDGQWMELARFEKKFKKSVVSIGALSVRLRPGGIYAIGDELAKSQPRSTSQGEAR